MDEAGCSAPDEARAHKTVFMGESDDAAHANYIVTGWEDAWEVRDGLHCWEAVIEVLLLKIFFRSRPSVSS